MLELSFGYPQIAAILILVQRGLEEIYSARNTKRLIAEGAQEVGRDYYPVVAITHLAWIAAIFMLIPVTAQGEDGIAVSVRWLFETDPEEMWNGALGAIGVDPMGLVGLQGDGHNLH